MWAAGGNQQENNQKLRIYEGTLDPKLPKYIQNLNIFGSVKITLKSNLTLFSPQVCRRKQTNSGHGPADHAVGAGGGTPADR